MIPRESDPVLPANGHTGEAKTDQVQVGSSNSRMSVDRFISLEGRIALSVLLVCFGVFYTATIRDGNYWSDDYALYVHHAQNIAEGRPYADTGHVYNRDVTDYSPSAYPPVFPLLLAPVYRACGLNLHAMKVEEVVILLLTLLAVLA